MNMRLGADELRDINEMRRVMEKANKAGRQPHALTHKEMERGTNIVAWGRMARGGLGLGTGRCTLDDGRRDPASAPISIEEFELVSRMIGALPTKVQCVLVHLYQISDKPVASFTAVRLGTTRSDVEECRDQGLGILYGALCVRTVW